MRVLVVEDELYLAEAVAEGLRQWAMAVDVCGDGMTALEMISINRYDIVVLDRDLPRLHGDEVCRTVAAGGGEPRVIMLTAAGTVEDRVGGLGIGADDYLVKPFSLAELVARVQALGRRSGVALPPVLRRCGIEVDVARHRALRDGRPLPLSPKEFAVLETLMRADGAVVSAEELLEKAWDEHVDPFTNSVRVIMMTLRRKLGNPTVIETVSGVGYRLDGTPALTSSAG